MKLNVRQKHLYIIILTAIVLTGLELSFRTYLYFSKKNRVFPIIIKKAELFKRTWLKPHPYLVYVFKPDHQFRIDGYGHPTVTTNRFGFRSTLEYDLKTVSKPQNTLRVATFGGSTTMGVNDDHEIWPYLIGKHLSHRFPDKKIEVLNEGIMGYTSLENLIDLETRVIDFDIDIYVLYLGINDYLAKAPPEVYRTDYSHFRKTLWENVSFSAVELLPNLLLESKVVTGFLYFLGAADRRLLLRNTGTGILRKKNFVIEGKNFDKIYSNVSMTVLRNIKSMAGIIRSHNPKALILLSSFYCVREKKNIKNLNSILADYAGKAGLVFVDIAGEMPHVRNMAYDYGHFTKEGDRRMGEIFAEHINDALNNR